MSWMWPLTGRLTGMLWKTGRGSCRAWSVSVGGEMMSPSQRTRVSLAETQQQQQQHGPYVYLSLRIYMADV